MPHRPPGHPDVPPAVPLSGSQLGWIVREFYQRPTWRFDDRIERREYFREITNGFDVRWPLRAHMFPHIPFQVALDYPEQQEVFKQKEILRRVSCHVAVTSGSMVAIALLALPLDWIAQTMIDDHVLSLQKEQVAHHLCVL
ncbi:hypothetical protein JVU11DRAFT_11068 [Chiua virens]|nr:hypothetical protein JVU11DRAFT_11068 [Chiua virens]